MKIFHRKEFERIGGECHILSELAGGGISTGSRGLDVLLRGGLPSETITHVYGPAGSGKSNLCISAAIECARQGGKALYIDTEGGFRIERFLQMCGEPDVAKRVLVKQIHDSDEQGACIRGLDSVLNEEHRLLIVDSLVSLYRLRIEGGRKEILALSRELGRQLGWLSRIARRYKLAVLVTNQVYETFKDDGREVVPVGGDVLLYWAKVSLELEKAKKPGSRICRVVKHPFAEEGSEVAFRLVERGLK